MSERDILLQTRANRKLSIIFRGILSQGREGGDRGQEYSERDMRAGQHPLKYLNPEP